MRVAVARDGSRTARRRRCSAPFTSTATDDYLLLQEHPHVYTLGSSAKAEHVLRDPASVGAELVHADRGGDVTYHGPGQLVGYPIVSLAEWRARSARRRRVRARGSKTCSSRCCADFGIAAGALARVHGRLGRRREDRRDRCARVARGRTRHGFALNVDPDLTMFEHIVPCGISDRGVTSMARRARRGPSRCARSSTGSSRDSPTRSATPTLERQDVAWERPARARAGARIGIALTRKRPDWMRVRARFDDEFLELKKLGARQGPPHRVRGSGLPEHLRVLGATAPRRS